MTRNLKFYQSTDRNVIQQQISIVIIFIFAIIIYRILLNISIFRNNSLRYLLAHQKLDPSDFNLFALFPEQKLFLVDIVDIQRHAQLDCHHDTRQILREVGTHSY